jgi:Spy/CpxP family protein refolding chaperone
MTRRNTSTGIALAALVLCCSGPNLSASELDAVTGASPNTGQGHHASWDGKQGEAHERMTRWADELGLSAQQRSDMQIISADYATRFRDLAQLGRDAAQDLMQTAPDDPSYYGKTQDASALAASSAAELVTLLAEMRAKLYSVLTPDQRDKFHEMLRSHHDANDEQTPAE